MASTSSRRRQPLGFPLFRHQPLQEVHALTQLPDLLAHPPQFVDFAPQLPHFLGHVLVELTRQRFLEDPRGNRFTHGRNGQQHERAATEDGQNSNERNEPVFHRTLPLNDSNLPSSPLPATPSAGTGRCAMSRTAPPSPADLPPPRVHPARPPRGRGRSPSRPS